MGKFSLRYWVCQFIGWGGWATLNLYIATLYAREMYLNPEEKRRLFFIALAIDFVWCLLVSHALRMILKQSNWMRYSIGKVVIVFILGVASCTLVSHFGAKFTAQRTNLSFYDYTVKERKTTAEKMEIEMGLVNTQYFQKPEDKAFQERAMAKIKSETGWYRDNKQEWKFEEQRNRGREFWNIFFSVVLFSLWMLIYFTWHYMSRNRNDQMDKLRLETTVKELELKTIKSHINPHFMFNSLNSIRALVDENPQRARRAITELSNILRSSMQAEKMETVPLERELDIVNDYLALEQMRFEERLKVKMDIDEDTLGQPIPPMMLQTLVENAIKHGISKQINGGSVNIISDFRNNHHELIVQNTGQLSDSINSDGFGIKSTEDRLNLLYQGKASFKIYNLNGEMVESKIVMPVAGLNH